MANLPVKSKKSTLADTRLYGRRKGRPLSTARHEALTELMPALGIPEKKLTEDGALAPGSLFDSPAPTILEIGFGNGEHVKGLMEQSPGTNFLACEPFENGMSAFLKSIHHTPLRNVRVLMDDALKLCLSLTSECLDGIYILNPDPWPKARHHKRRIVSQENLTTFARILKPGGFLTMTTDVDDLAEWMVTQASMHHAFRWTADKADDWKTMPEGWIQTRYEQKGIKAGRKQTYLLFEKKR
ncbi:MAG: tRNA (guanosine(46)-N7)-methyltransferase TrmB [Alphaproteobacteria bacterium]|nr:tRNA (guanosine(46)-N7)-methyltransferase TrmB [Alphaproteobacteria bacterium]MCD8570543.1 tRNA (guanosine(46)-N7)-methyltransferase TrmB [Alphaproteobacteria bacterium]